MTSEPRQDKMATRIANGILGVQEKFSGWMNRLRHLKFILVCFCILSAFLSTWLIIEAIAFKPKSKVRIDRIRSPRAMPESEQMYDEKIPDEIYYSIQEYKRHMDSAGEAIRPGLLDSMRVIEETYLQQQK